MGAALTNPLTVNINQAVPQGAGCIVGLPTTPARALIGWTGGSGTSDIYSAVANTAAGTIQSTAQTISSNSTVQNEINCFTSNGEGRIAWVRGAQSLVQRMATNGAPIGSNYVLQGTLASAGFPTGLGTPDNNAFIAYSPSVGGFSPVYGGTFSSDVTGTPQSSALQIPFNPNNDGQNPGSLALLNGTATNYNVLFFYQGQQISGIDRMYARAINVQTDATTPTPTPSSTTPTPTPSSTTPTPTPTPTSTPTSAAGSLQPGMLQAPAMLVSFGIKSVFQFGGWLIGK